MIARKCTECKKTIDVTLNTINDIVYFDKKYYHLQCFLKMCERKSTSRSKKCAEKWTEVTNNIDSIRRASNDFLIESIYKDMVYDFMLQNYNVKVIPSVVFQKLDAFYSGDFKGLSQPIKPQELYEMWTMKIKYLNKVDVFNRQKGKKIEGAARIKYDLSILLNKYDDYLAWKEKQKKNTKEKEQLEKTVINEVKVKKAIANMNSAIDEKEDEMDDLLDEIFG